MIRRVGRDVVHFAVDDGPGVDFLIVKFQDEGLGTYQLRGANL